MTSEQEIIPGAHYNITLQLANGSRAFTKHVSAETMAVVVSTWRKLEAQNGQRVRIRDVIAFLGLSLLPQSECVKCVARAHDGCRAKRATTIRRDADRGRRRRSSANIGYVTGG